MKRWAMKNMEQWTEYDEESGFEFLKMWKGMEHIEKLINNGALLLREEWKYRSWRRTCHGAEKVRVPSHIVERDEAYMA